MGPGLASWVHTLRRIGLVPFRAKTNVSAANADKPLSRSDKLYLARGQAKACLCVGVCVRASVGDVRVHS